MKIGQLFKKELIKDIHKLAKILASNEGHNISKENLHACVGIEVLLHKDWWEVWWRRSSIWMWFRRTAAPGRVKYSGLQKALSEVQKKFKGVWKQILRACGNLRLVIGNFWMIEGWIYFIQYCVIPNVFFCFIVMIAIKDNLWNVFFSDSLLLCAYHSNRSEWFLTWYFYTSFWF